MPRTFQGICATDQQTAGLNAIADKLGIEREDFGHPYDGSSAIRTFMSREEVRRLGQLAFDLDTSVAALARGAIRSMLGILDAAPETSA